MIHPLEHIEPAEMRRPEIALLEFHQIKRDRIARDIARAFGRCDHVRDQHIIEPRIVLTHETVYIIGERLCFSHCAACRVGLADSLRWAEEGGKWPRITSDHPAYFYTLRSADHGNRDLVNMLLSQLSPKDVRQLFICHKELFYQLYATWHDTKKSYVAEFLEREYQVDKAGARAALFGHEPEMEQPVPAPKKDGPWGVSEKKIAAVGPWGAVRGK